MSGTSKKKLKKSLVDESCSAVVEEKEQHEEQKAAPKANDDDNEDEGGDSNDADAPKRKRKRNRTRKGKGDKAKDDADGEEPTNDSAPPTVSDLVEGTVYVEGLSYDADDADVKGFFEQVGAVSAIRMPRWHDSGKPRGYAHVVFEDEANVSKAITELNNQRLMGRYLKVALPKEPKAAPGGPRAAQPEGCRTIFVKNLPYDCDEDSVRRVMAAFGEVRDVRLACSTTGGGSSAGGSTRLKGFGYVQFASEVGTRKAAEAATNGKLVLSGRKLYVDYDEAKGPKGSFRRTDGELWSDDKAL